MLHVHFPDPTPIPDRTLAQRILTPAHYLRLRRTHAGLSVAALAERIEPRHAARPEATAMIRMLESDGVTALRRPTIDRLARVFPLDVDVYFQLANDPVDQRPRVCMGCGCSTYDPCTGSDGICTWSIDDACSRCLDRAIAQADAA